MMLFIKMSKSISVVPDTSSASHLEDYTKSPFTNILLSLIIPFIPNDFKEFYELRLVSKSFHSAIHNHCDGVWVKLAFSAYKIRKAVEKGDHYILEKALKHHLPMEIDDVFYHAIDKNNIVAMEMIIKTGVIGLLDNYNEALCSACGKGNVPLVERFITLGANVNYIHKFGSPLIEAVEEGHIDVVRYLISKGADINRGVGIGGRWPVEVAVCSGNVAIAELLLSTQADKCCRYEGRRSREMRLACRNDVPEMIRLLHRYGYSLDGTCDNVSHLVYCISKNKMEAHKTLLELYANGGNSTE